MKLLRRMLGRQESNFMSAGGSAKRMDNARLVALKKSKCFGLVAGFVEEGKSPEARMMKKDASRILFLLSVTQPGQVGLTSVGFAAPARAGCAFIASVSIIKPAASLRQRPDISTLLYAVSQGQEFLGDG
jgi:hypothetical protein